MSKGLFDLTNFESMDDDDIISMNINESTEPTEDGDIDEILEATRYNLEFEKELNNYNNLWNTYNKYKTKMSKLKDDKKSAEYNQKVDTLLKSKEDELESAYDKLINNYGKTIVKYAGDTCKLKNAIRSFKEDPSKINTKLNIGKQVSDQYNAIGLLSGPSMNDGNSIKSEERRTNLHGAKDSDGSVEPGRYNMKESTEFSDKNPDTNHPEVPFETGGASGHETNIPVPGGLKETPSAKPADEASISIPGGLSETPSTKPADAASIPVPSKITLTSDQYNCALTALKKSFKEGYEIMEMLENANVVTETIDDIQDEFVENAILTAFEDGPIFEAVNRHDKHDVKAIVRKIRPEIYSSLKEVKIKCYKPAMVARLFTGVLGGVGTVFQNIWKNRLWQVLGIILCEDANVNEITDSLTEKFKEDLGEYKILAVKTNRNIIDMFRTKFGWKNNAKAYFILVDKKIPKELKEVEKMVVNAAKEEEKAEDTTEEKKD